jgi:large subunit ribosomal protein L22
MAATRTDDRRTNERPGVRAQHRHARFSAYKAREVLDLIRNKPVAEARTILQFCDRAAADTVMKVLDSAVANAANNNDIPPEELFVAACYADEGPTMKRWRPRARGRATRIRKRTCHITVIVGRYSGAELDAIRERLASRGRVGADAAADRARRVARSRAAQEAATTDDAGTPDDDAPSAEVAEDVERTEGDEVTTTDEAVSTDTDTDGDGADAEEAAAAADGDATDEDATDETEDAGDPEGVAADGADAEGPDADDSDRKDD